MIPLYLTATIAGQAYPSLAPILRIKINTYSIKQGAHLHPRPGQGRSPC